MILIPFGGHTAPISITGAKLEAKNAQKNAKKNITSEVINKIIPILIPSCTHTVWLPSKVASLITSCHHKNIVNKTIEKPEIPTKAPFGYKCIYITPPVVRVNAENAPTSGHGLGFTI
jgi:hypothetical protein